MLTPVIFVLVVGEANKAVGKADGANLRSAEVMPSGSIGTNAAEQPLEIIEMLPVEQRYARPMAYGQNNDDVSDVSLLLPDIMSIMGALEKQHHGKGASKNIPDFGQLLGKGVDDEGAQERSSKTGTSKSAPNSSGSGSGSDSSGGFDQERFGIVRIQSTVEVKNLFAPWQDPEGEESFVGSGFIVALDEHGADPLVVTNAHVVTDASYVCMQIPANGQECYQSIVHLINHDWDLAILRPNRAMVTKMKDDLGDNKLHQFALISKDDTAVSQGTQVLALGFPLGKESLAVTSGIVAGTEVVGDSVQLQSDAPISPGNSGGPLILRDGPNKGKVIGVNFASAVQMGSQNNNFAIPAFRVGIMITQYVKHHADYTSSKCKDNTAQCSLKVPPIGATAVKGNEALYSYYNCPEGKGALITKVDAHSAFAKAGIKSNSFITKVGDVELDRFGMGVNDAYLQDSVKFNDLIYMTHDLAKTTEVTMCKCGETKTYQVSHEWSGSYDSAVPSDDQPNLGLRDYVTFANITMQQLSKSLAHTLILKQGELQLIPYVVEDNNKSAVIVTDVGKVELSHGGRKSLNVGNVVQEINGKTISTMQDVKDAFGQTSSSACSTSSGSSSKKVWTMKTKDGKILAVPYVEELTRLSKTGSHSINDFMKGVMSDEGITISSSTLLQKAERSKELDRESTFAAGVEVMPIEYRDVYRGGMTVSKALKDAVASSFLEDDEVVVPAKPSSFAQMGPGGMAPQSLMQLHRRHRAHPSSLMQMGPGAMEPESLMQLGRVHK